MEMPIEGLHTETGPGVLEAALAYDAIAAAADKGFLFKTFTKALAEQHSLRATFMAKWSNALAGQSGNIHLSLRDRPSGKHVFFDGGPPYGTSTGQSKLVAGLQSYLPEFIDL